MPPGSINSPLLAPSVPASTLLLPEWCPVSGHDPSSEALYNIPVSPQLSNHHGPILNSTQASADSPLCFAMFQIFLLPAPSTQHTLNSGMRWGCLCLPLSKAVPAPRCSAFSPHWVTYISLPAAAPAILPQRSTASPPVGVSP